MSANDLGSNGQTGSNYLWVFISRELLQTEAVLYTCNKRRLWRECAIDRCSIWMRLKILELLF